MNNRYTDITQTEKMVLHLLAISLVGEKKAPPFPAEELPYVDWEAVRRESLFQTVSLMMLDAVAVYRKHLPAELYDAWIQTSGDMFYQNSQVFSAQMQLVDELKTKGIPYVILKGAAAAARYPRPELRILGDVDFLVERSFLAQAEELMVENGYERMAMEHDCHVVFYKNQVRFEMHFETVGIPYGQPGEMVREYMKGAVSAGGTDTMDGLPFSVPNVFHQGLILLLHMQHHTLGEGLGLRHLCDWLVYVRDTMEEPHWEEHFIPFLKSIGLFTYAAVMTKIGALYLGLSCPSWAQVADDELCRKMIKDILTGGNFGQKDLKRAGSSVLISEHGKNGTRHGAIYHLTHALHRNVLFVYPLVKRVPVLYPFFYVYRVLRHLFLIAQGKRLSLTEMAAPAFERKAVYKQLHIFETEKQ